MRLPRKIFKFALLLVCLFSISTTIPVKASNLENDTLYVSTDVNIIVFSLEYTQAKEILGDFIRKNDIKIQNQVETIEHQSISFDINKQQYEKFNLILPKLGYVSSKIINTDNNNKKVKEILLELEHLKKNKDAYTKLLSRILLAEIDATSGEYFKAFEDEKRINEKIFAKEKELIAYSSKYNKYSVKLILNNEISSPKNNRVNFVNMPGIEYSFLNIETPTEGISAQNYSGFSLKYLFTKGKSYASLGVLKGIAPSLGDTSTMSEIYLFSFGQDFYSRHLGRGTNNFLNLYSSYTFGYMYGAAEINEYYSLYFLPSIGMEIYKNKYILIDTKVSYFIPFTHNKSLRGVNYGISFNFIF